MRHKLPIVFKIKSACTNTPLSASKYCGWNEHMSKTRTSTSLQVAKKNNIVNYVRKITNKKCKLVENKF